MNPIDLDAFPEDSEQVLMALWENEQQTKDKEYQNEWMTRSSIAGRTNLNKQQVRYRLNKLVNSSYVDEDTVKEHNQRVTYYRLLPRGKNSAMAIGEAEDVLGEIPEEISRQDLLKLTHEIATLRAEIEAAGFEIANVETSQFMEEVERVDNAREFQSNEIDEISKEQVALGDRIGRIERKLDINPPEIN